MSEQKRKTSKLCLTGFILSILFPVMLLLVNLSLGRYARIVFQIFLCKYVSVAMTGTKEIRLLCYPIAANLP